MSLPYPWRYLSKWNWKRIQGTCGLLCPASRCCSIKEMLIESPYQDTSDITSAKHTLVMDQDILHKSTICDWANFSPSQPLQWKLLGKCNKPHQHSDSNYSAAATTAQVEFQFSFWEFLSKHVAQLTPATWTIGSFPICTESITHKSELII